MVKISSKKLAFFSLFYLIYLSDKKGLKWFLKRKTTKSLYVTRRIKLELPSIDPENIDKVT